MEELLAGVRPHIQPIDDFKLTLVIGCYFVNMFEYFFSSDEDDSRSKFRKTMTLYIITIINMYQLVNY